MIEWIANHKNTITGVLELITAVLVLGGYIGGHLSRRSADPERAELEFNAEVKEVFSRNRLLTLDGVLCLLAIIIGWMIWRRLPEDKWGELAVGVGAAFLHTFRRSVEGEAQVTRSRVQTSFLTPAAL